MAIMGPDRITSDRLVARLSEIYADGKLDQDAIQHETLRKTYEEATIHVRSQIGVKEKREWSGYGCGFASFLDSWFYREDDEFEVVSTDKRGKNYRGVFVIFSLVEPMFAAGEGKKRWDTHDGASYLPTLNMIDVYESECTKQLSGSICTALRDLGIPQVSRCTLGERLPVGIRIESNMASEPLAMFDAFYHWMD